jgi:transposase
MSWSELTRLGWYCARASAERAEALVGTIDDAMTQTITALESIHGIGANFATVLVREVLYRSFANRRQIASYVGITPMPYQSGGMDRDRSISRADNPRARTPDECTDFFANAGYAQS